MIDKLKYKIWKLKTKKLNNIFFLIKKNIYVYREKIRNNGSKTISYINELAISFFYLVIISLMILMLCKLESILYQYFYSYFESIRKILTFSENYFFDFLIASLGISGVLIALFFANLSGVFSSKYINLDSQISFEILNDKENKRSIKSIKNYIITNIVLIMFYLIGIKYYYLLMFMFVLYTIRIVIAFINLSQRIFYFTDLNNITRKIIGEIYDNFKQVQINGKYNNNKEIQNYYKVCTKSNLDKLNMLIEAFIKSNDYNSIYKYENNIIRILNIYTREKNKIPYYSLWYADKYKPKSMFLLNGPELITYANEGVIPNPEKDKNINWIEEEIFNLIYKGLSFLIKNDELSYSYKIIENLNKVLDDSQKYGNSNSITKFELLMFQNINKNFNYNEKNDHYIQAILELESLLFMGTIIESNVYIKKCKEIIDKLNYKETNFKKLLKNNLAIFNNDKTEKICNQLSLEKKIEKKIITDDRYIKEFFYCLIYKEINNIFNTYVEILNNAKDKTKEMYENNRYNAVKIMIAKNIEMYRKLEYSYKSIDKILQEIIKTKKDFIWLDELPKNFMENLKDFMLENLLLGINVLKTMNQDNKKHDDSEFDIFGLIFYNTYLFANNLLINGNYNRFEKINNELLGLSIISDNKIKTEVKLNAYNTEFAIDKYLKPYIYFMDMQGKMIYLARIIKDDRWENLVNKQVERIKKIDIFDTLVEYGNVNKNRLSIDWFRNSMNSKFKDDILKKAKIEYTNGLYDTYKIISDDEIVQKFELDEDKFYEIYLCYYVNKKATNKFIASNYWNEGEENEN